MSKKKTPAFSRASLIGLLTGHLLFSAAIVAQSSATFHGSVKEIHQLVDSLANQINKYYVFKAEAQNMSAFIRKRCREGHYDSMKDPNHLAGVITADVLSVNRDEHFYVEYNPAKASELLGNIDDVPKMVSERLQQERSKNFGFKHAEILNGNIGYLEISSFARLNAFSEATANAALNYLSNSSAIIIDLRYGVGGSPEMVNHIIGHFLKERTHVMDIYIRSENTTLPYFAGGQGADSALAKLPVYILTSYKTFSAAEGLCYELQSLKRATIVGETTRGGAHIVTYRPLSGGFISDIPFGSAISPITKTNWEITGVKPDIACAPDDALETAELKIFETALAAAKDSSEIKRLFWQRDLLQASNHPAEPDKALLNALPGKYGAYTISASNGKLYYQKTGKAKFQLLPLKDHALKIKGNDTFRVTYATEADGSVKKICTLYDDGRKETAVREN